MFSSFTGNRIAFLFITSTLGAALVVPLGCRCFSNKTASVPLPASSPAQRQNPVPQPVTVTSNPPVNYTTYRPPLTNEIIGKETVVSRQEAVESISLPPQIPNAAPAIPQPDDAAKPEVTQLQEENRLLKEKLKEAEAKAAATQPALPLPSKPEQLAEEQGTPKPLPNPPVGVPKLPAINKQGVTVSQDEQKRTRVEVVDKVLFTPNTWQLTADGEETLRTIAAEIKASQPNAVLDVEGHTDSLIGDPKNEMQKHDISSIKSMAVMEFFINTLKWDTSKIRTSSHGRSRPVADNGTPEGRARNNRIELAVQN